MIQLLGLLAGIAVAAAGATGFDHFIHEGRVTGSGGVEPVCLDCHELDRAGHVRGRPDHAACFGTCHGAPPSKLRRGKALRIEPAVRTVCTSCHAEDALVAAERASTRRVPVAFPPYVHDRDYALALSHAAHVEAAGCESCHAMSARRARAAPKPHARCVHCHQTPVGNAPPMAECAACHRSAFGPAVGPSLERGTVPVSARFSHDSHLARMAAAGGRDCLACHAQVAETTGERVPSPAMQTCERCHDGTAAFGALDTTCRRCHDAAANKRLPRPKRAPFSHASHVERGMKTSCDSCHRPDAGHAACASAECHAADFRSTTPITCGACHIGVEPWRPLHDEPPPRATTEFGARYSHAAHTALASNACERCHVAGGAGRRARGGHAMCAGAGCHDDRAPVMAECAACHQLGALVQRNESAAARRWSVRSKFRHDLHPPERAACAQCHDGIDATRGLDDIPAPPKARCQSCHDGKTSFKMTGHGCARCHGAVQPRR